MRATNRTFGTKNQYDSTQTMSEYVPASHAFSFLKFYQHSFLFFCKVIPIICHYAAEHDFFEQYHTLPQNGRPQM